MRANHPRALNKRRLKAEALIAGEAWSEAEAMLAPVYAAQTHLLGPHHVHTTASREGLALVLVGTGRFTEAVDLHAINLDTFAHVFGEDDPRTVTVKSNLGRALYAASRFIESAEVYGDVVKSRVSARGEAHPSTRASRLLLSQAQRALAAHDELEASMRVLLGASGLGDDTRGSRILAHLRLAELTASRGDRTTAIAQLRLLVEQSTARWGTDAPTTLACDRTLASALLDDGQLEEAAALGADLVERRTRAAGENARHTLCTRHELGAALCELGRLDEAETEVRAAIDGRGPAAELYCSIACRSTLAKIAARRGQTEAAAEQFLRLLAETTTVYGTDHPHTAEIRAQIDQLK